MERRFESHVCISSATNADGRLHAGSAMDAASRLESKKAIFFCVCEVHFVGNPNRRSKMVDVHGCTHCRVVFVGSPAEDSETLYSAPAKPGSFPSQIWLGHVLPTSASQLKHGARCNPGQRRSASVPAVMA